MTNGVIDELRAARMVGTPLIGITTADPPALVLAIVKAKAGAGQKEPPILQHDIIRGLVGLNAEGQEAAALIAPGDDVLGNSGGPVLTSPAEALGAAVKLPRRSVLLVHNAQALRENVAVLQAVCNLRDAFKSDGRCLVLLDAALSLPAQLVHDVLLLDDPFPAPAEIAEIIETELANAQSMTPPPEVPDEATKARAVAALTGLARFPAEQAVAISLNYGRLDPDRLWERKRALINQTKGLAMDVNRLSFDMLGGLEEIKRHGRAINAGPEPPSVYVRMDEIEKLMAGSRGDSSGTSQDQKGVILREMEDNGWTGYISVGPPGSGKTAITQALGTTFGAPMLSFDLGAAKDKLVGSSEQLIRQCMKVIKAIGGANVYFVATCNDISAGVITPDLLRRFTDGVWYFDLCSAEEKAAIWPIHLAKYGHALDAERPNDRNYTGAEIRNVCRLAYRRRCSLIDAARSIVPIAVSSAESIEKLRREASGKFLSASYPGTYKHPTGAAPLPLPTPETPVFPDSRTLGRFYEGKES